MHEESGPSWGMRGLRKWLGTAPETRNELLKFSSKIHVVF